MMRRMKTTTLLCTLVLLGAMGCKKSDSASGSGAAAAGASGAQAAALGPLSEFEGEIDVVAKSTKDKVPATPVAVLIKTGRLRFDIPKTEGRPATKGYIVMNARDKKAIMVDEDKKTAMVFDVGKLATQLGQIPGQPPTPRAPAAGEAPPKITKTGHTDVVAGFQCEDWDITSNDGKRARVCVSEGAASWLDVVAHAVPGNLIWAKEFLNGQKFPLRVIAFETDGTERDRIEVTKIEKKTLDESLFGVPPGYRTLDLEQMMNGFMAGGMPAGMAPGQMPGMPTQMPAMPTQMPAMPTQMPAMPNMPAQMPATMPNVPPGQIPTAAQGGLTAAQRAQMEEAMKKMREQLEQQQRGAQP